MTEPLISEKYALTLVRVTKLAPAEYSLDEAAHLTNLHPEMLRYYCQLGLLGEALAQSDIELTFDDDALYQVQRFENYRLKHRVSRKTLRLIFTLWRNIEVLQTELRFLRRS